MGFGNPAGLMKSGLEFAAEKIADHMDKILTHFKPGSKITVLVRQPDNDQADFCLSNDDIAQALAALQRRLDAGQTGEV
ncbi:hypothetical protein J2X45_003364 [Caulobacter sp. BE264]|uniref:hypothetical protein n=1 Tax=Caulobacter sp. BE264 TaxID=2817724 RepID=UPI002862D350|nr:hypothetical protein [Caulobacter sp. BE264]MDR7232258.1 hypothetical protein [Caulobacter sp. BE264]